MYLGWVDPGSVRGVVAVHSKSVSLNLLLYPDRLTGPRQGLEMRMLPSLTSENSLKTLNSLT